MKLCEPEVYAKHIVQSWICIAHALFLDQLEFWYACSYQNLPKIFQKISKPTSYTRNQAISSYKSSNVKTYITNIKQIFKIITFLKNICSLLYPIKLMSNIFKQEISDFLSMSSFWGALLLFSWDAALNFLK